MNTTKKVILWLAVTLVVCAAEGANRELEGMGSLCLANDTNDERPGCGCYDSMDDCVFYQLAGLCATDDTIKGKCKHACGACSSSCFDGTRTCNQVKKEGNCGTPFGHEHCRKTCGICTCKDRYSASYCEDVLVKGLCYFKSYSGKYRERCARTCGMCGCKDNSDHCEGRVARGECVTRSSFMLRHCRKSCGFCMDTCRDLLSECKVWSEKKGCSWHLARVFCPASCNICKPETEPEPKPDPVTCKDKSEDCPIFARQEKCNIGHIRSLCPFSCRTCVCGDTRRECAARAGLGYCSLAPSFMEKNCALSCGHCKCQDTDDSCPTWASQGKCTKSHDYLVKCPESCNVCTCGDNKVTCTGDAIAGKCVTDTRFMATHCAASCNFCGDHCADNPPLDVSCAQRQLNGECETQKDLMILHCAKTCGFCKPDEDDGHTTATEETAMPWSVEDEI